MSEPPQNWPAGTQISLNPHRFTLVMFAHPKCPCTRATLEELNRVMAGAKQQVAATVLFFAPGNLAGDWVRTDLWRTAARIPGVSVEADCDGLEARRFGARTSGAVLLFDRAGRLCFRGGITGSRGHAGANSSEAALLEIIRKRQKGPTQTPVYGCSLDESEPVASELRRGM